MLPLRTQRMRKGPPLEEKTGIELTGARNGELLPHDKGRLVRMCIRYYCELTEEQYGRVRVGGDLYAFSLPERSPGLIPQKKQHYTLRTYQDDEASFSVEILCRNVVLMVAYIRIIPEEVQRTLFESLPRLYAA